MQKNIAIFGLGISGISTANFYANKNYKVYVDDDNKNSLKSLNNKNIIKKGFHEWPWHSLDYLVLAPGIPLNFPEPHNVVAEARKNRVKIICDIECLFLEKRDDIQLIGITGTNGKSTTTALTNHILKECGKNSEIGGNFGIPALDLNLNEKGYKVIEISSFQLELLDKTFFHRSLLLNITPDHLARHGGMDNYIKAKERIFEKADDNSISFICTDQGITEKIYKKFHKKNNITSYKTDAFEDLSRIEFENLPGKHNLQNIIGAYLICYSLGINKEEIISAIKSFKGLEHRIEKVCENDCFIAINDSKATNADATEPALKTFDNIIWLAGGVQKEGGIESLQYLFPKIEHAIFYGEAKDDFALTYKRIQSNFATEKNLKQAISSAKDFCKNNKNEKGKFVILLSPACASFDEFKNYEERGKFFKSQIMDGDL